MRCEHQFSGGGRQCADFGFSCRELSRINAAVSPVLRALVLLCVCSCQSVDPPAGTASEGVLRIEVQAGGRAEPPHWAASAQNAQYEARPDAEREALGSVEDNLPFEPNGEKLGSTAWRTWIYTDTGPGRTRLGYLRAGAVVDRRGPAIRNDGCRGEWYRINPRGFVCVGKGATLDLDDPIVRALTRRAQRGAGLPYTYTLVGETAPFLYYRLPTSAQMQEVEGAYQSRAARWLLVRKQNRIHNWLSIDTPPNWLVDGSPLPKPYGIDSGLRRSVHTGQAAPDSGFALANVFEWEQRAFGLSTELDLVPMDRTALVKPSDFAGVVLEPEETLPVLRVTAHWVNVYPIQEDDTPGKPRAVPRRTLLKLTGEKRRLGGVLYWETTSGEAVASVGVEVIKPRTSFPSIATGNRKWIDVSLSSQVLVAYEGRKPVFVTLVSTGAGGLGDPEKVPSTVQGTFMIHSKHVTATMNGDDDRSDSYSLRDVPFVQYFHKGYALHGTYWHDDFGRWRSHGCVNLSGRDSSWLFEWTDPPVPDHWHAVLNKERGTVVVIRP